LQLNFAGLVSAEGLDVLVEVDPSSGGYYIFEVILTPNDNAFSAAFPYSSFTGRHGDRCWQRNRINGWSDHGQRKHNLTWLIATSSIVRGMIPCAVAIIFLTD
jgi:hypothetical protein